jgi:hypothetical protein
MTLSAYEDLVHELSRLDADTTANTAQATRQLERRRETLREVRSDLDEETMALAELCARLRATTPNLHPDAPEVQDSDAVGIADSDEDPDAVLTQAKVALREAAAARTATVRAAQRPTLMPKAHHILRELLVYGSCMIACLAVQLSYLAASGTGGDALITVVYLLPVMALAVGYLLVGVANKPRLPLLDRTGKPVKPVVPRNPRLGVTLAVCTMALSTYFAFFA